MRVRSIVVALAAATPAAADPKPLDNCPTTKSIARGSKTAVDLRTTYVLSTGLRVCVDRANYPYAGPGKGHHLFACVVAAEGKDVERFCGTGNSFANFHGYRIEVSLRKPRFTESSDVWLQID
jgi:hypothetical protein